MKKRRIEINKKIKVLIINSVIGFGSTGRIVKDLYQVLENNNYDCCIAYGRGRNNSNCKTIRISSIVGSYLHALFTRITDNTGFYSNISTRNLIKKVKMFNPDIIHIHNLHGYYINIEILFKYIKDSKKQIIWTLHDCWPFTGHCTHFDYIGCLKWKTECYRCIKQKEYPASYIIDNSKKNYHRKKNIFSSIDTMTLVSPSKWLSTLVKESFLSMHPLKVINNGIDTDIFSPKIGNFRKSYHIEDKVILLGVASGWDDLKGYKYFLELSKILDNKYVIILIGINRQQKKKLPDNIIGIERTDNLKMLVEIYSTADMFINPTLEDNFPTTNLEALACGTPVITFNTGGSVECINNKNGIIVEKGNIQQLINAVYTIAEKRIEYRENIKNDIYMYKKQDKYNEYINIYKTLIEKRKN